jgi:hypothetical protein
MERRCGKNHRIRVMDRGMVSEDNIEAACDRAAISACDCPRK